jgi:hypothetical protein
VIDELRWYFAQARTHAAPSRCNDLAERFFQAREAFSAPRFKALYRIWKQDGDRVVAELGSAASVIETSGAAHPDQVNVPAMVRWSRSG